MSTVTIELPDLIRKNLQEPQELSRFALEAIALEGYRRVALTQGQVGEMLGLSFWQTEEFLRAHGAFLHYDMEDFKKDLQALEQVQAKRIFAETNSED